MRSTWCTFCLVWLFSLVVSPALAEYRLQPGDTVEISVAQQTNLNRQAVIAPDGRLSLPLAGHLQAEGLTVEELEAALVERLSSFFKDKLNLTVMLLPNPQHMPTVFVVGDVNTPGAFPFRQDMTVLHAVSVSGGLFRSALLAADRDRALVVEGEIERQRKRLVELQLKMARLQAELDDRDKIEVPAQVNSSISKGVLDDLLAEEQKILERRRDEVQVQLDAKKHIDEITQRSAAAAQEQMQTVTQRIDLAKQRLASTSILVDKGLANVSVRLEIEGSIAELEGMRNSLQSAMATAEGSVAAEANRLQGLLEERRTRDLLDLQDTRREADELAASMADSENVLSIYSNDAANTRGRNATRTVEYRIVRSENGQTSEIEANEMTKLRPGDLVRVVFVDTSGQSEAQLTGGTATGATGQ